MNVPEPSRSGGLNVTPCNTRSRMAKRGNRYEDSVYRVGCANRRSCHSAGHNIDHHDKPRIEQRSDAAVASSSSCSSASPCSSPRCGVDPCHRCSCDCASWRLDDVDCDDRHPPVMFMPPVALCDGRQHPNARRPSTRTISRANIFLFPGPLFIRAPALLPAAALCMARLKMAGPSVPPLALA